MSKTIFNTFTEFDDIMFLFCFKYCFNLKKITIVKFIGVILFY